jgi:cytochrome c oxidase subunit 2
MTPRRRLLRGAIALAAGALVEALPAQESRRVIPVVARKFVFLPRDIHVKLGEAVTLELTAPEVVMGFYAPELDLRTLIVPGQVSRVSFTAVKAGTFPFLCDIFCGDGHEQMSGQIIVA